MKMTKSDSEDIHIEIANRQSELDFDEDLLCGVLKNVLIGEGLARAELSVAVVSDSEMKDVNRRFTGRDEPTDVVAFVYEKSEFGRCLVGEVVVNASQAMRESSGLRHDAGAELLLYSVHGVLHLSGWEDDTDCRRAAMNRSAVDMLARDGVEIDSGTLLDSDRL